MKAKIVSVSKSFILNYEPLILPSNPKQGVDIRRDLPWMSVLFRGVDPFVGLTNL